MRWYLCMREAGAVPAAQVLLARGASPESRDARGCCALLGLLCAPYRSCLQPWQRQHLSRRVPVGRKSSSSCISFASSEQFKPADTKNLAGCTMQLLVDPTAWLIFCVKSPLGMNGDAAGCRYISCAQDGSRSPVLMQG